MCKTLRFCFASFVLLAICALSAMAQSTVTGAISGTVSNPNKAVIAGATITAKNTGTNKEETETTGNSGRCKIVNLQPGTYTLTVNAAGCGRCTNENVIVEVRSTTTINVGISHQANNGTV